MNLIGTGSKPSIKQRTLDNFMSNPLRRHRNELPPDEFDALVLVHDAGRDHRLDLRHRETPARQTLGGGGDAGS